MENTKALLHTWEQTYKKGLLSFWMLLCLHERPSYPYEMSTLINKFSQGTISVDGNSIYRALNRFELLGIVSSEMRESGSGPARRYYSLSRKGFALLKEFTRRNILVFESPVVAGRIRAVFEKKPSP